MWRASRSGRRLAVEDHRRVEGGRRGRQPGDDPPAPGEAERRHLARSFVTTLEPDEGRHRVGRDLVGVEAGRRRAGLVGLGRRAAARGEEIGGERQVARHREAARHVLDVVGAAPALVDDEDCRHLAFRDRRADVVGLEGPEAPGSVTVRAATRLSSGGTTGLAEAARTGTAASPPRAATVAASQVRRVRPR